MGTEQPPESTQGRVKQALWNLKDRLKEAFWPLTKPQNQLRASNLATTHDKKTATSTPKPSKTHHFWLPEPPEGLQRDPKRTPKGVPK